MKNAVNTQRLCVQELYPEFFAAKKCLGDAYSGQLQREDIGNALDSLVKNIKSMASSDDKDLCLLLLFYCHEYVRNPNDYHEEESSKRKSKTVATYKKRIITAFPKAYQVVKHGIKVSLTSPEKEAAQIIRAAIRKKKVSFAEHSDAKKILKAKVSQDLREFDFEVPQQILEIYGLDNTPPPLQEIEKSADNEEFIEKCALRVMNLILVHAFRRFRCLIGIQLQHFLIGQKFIEVIIPHTKNAEANMRLPLWALLPEEDIQFIRHFITFLRRQKDAKRKNQYPETMYLTELTAIGYVRRQISETGQDKFRDLMRKYCPAFTKGNGDGGTHQPRRFGCSWFPIRVMVMFNPWLLKKEPLLACCRVHVWFREDTMQRLRRMIPTESTDSLEILRRIGGWASTEQILKTYCRSWPLQILLQMHINQHRNRALKNARKK